MRSTTKNDKNEMGQILGDGRKWKNGTNFGGRREYNLIHSVICLNTVNSLPIT